MTFYDAKQCFDENTSLSHPPLNDYSRMIHWNLGRGLAELTAALQSELAQIHDEIQRLKTSIDDLKRNR